MRIIVLIFVVATFAAENCLGLFHYKRDKWNAANPTKTLNPYNGKASVVYLHPTVTPYCGIPQSANCKKVIKDLQTNHMKNNCSDLGYNFVVGGCTGVFEGAGWDQVAPFSENDVEPSIHIGVVGTYKDHIVSRSVAYTVKALIDEGVSKNRISSDFTVKCSYNMDKPLRFASSFGNIFPSFKCDQEREECNGSMDYDYVEVQ
ncbi:peptidoglycan-recognition protein SC2-like [Neocloeon triangulifer]|uniref:peptidoglycan-recognition protein SC2-like n=1 Tax=Neocloeon triangulifer TaxID=2078957 RepID=UPI00286F3B94|nr:peptidoglycan-recognition protein SC2-like [Neocloeon triangulifer]